MKMKGLIALLASTAAVASTTSTPVSTLTPGKYVLHTPDNTIPAPFTDKTNRFDTIELCDAAAKSLNKALKYKCDQSTGIAVTMTMTSTCADEKAPTLPLVKKAVDGINYWSIPEDGLVLPPPPSPENGWATMVYVYVQNSAWPAGYPNCWVRGFAPENTWRVNPNYPNTPFMERIVPGMAAVLEPPNSVEPVTLTAALQAVYNASEPARHEHDVCYPEDTAPCPPRAPPPPPPCDPSADPECIPFNPEA